MSPNEAFGVALILIACAVPVIVIGVVYYLKKRFEHKQIMIALEKGTPLSELRSVKPKPVGPIWIKYLSSGVLILVIGLAFIAAIAAGPRMGSSSLILLVGLILCGVGIASLIRGLLYRKYLPKSQPSANSNASENRNTPDVSTPETLQPTNE
jgi:sterol desaturase/sphingolipid hydroxylase (fatty acid hydroxylase superfamily)